MTEFNYDTRDLLTRLTDPAGNQTDFGYDWIGRRTSETDPVGASSFVAYDAASNVTSVTDRLGRVREFVYDPADRLTTERWKNGSTTVRTISYVYNDADELVSASDPDSTYGFSYDAAARLRTVNNAGTPLVPQVLLTNSYDTASRRTRLDNSSGVTGLPAAATAGFIKYDYDNADRLTRLQDGTVVTGSDVVSNEQGRSVGVPEAGCSERPLVPARRDRDKNWPRPPAVRLGHVTTVRARFRSVVCNKPSDDNRIPRSLSVRRASH